MSARVLAPVFVAVAALFAAAPLIGSVGATAVTGKAAAAKPAAPKAAPAATVHKISMKTGMAGGKMVYLDEKGTVNPTLKANVGDTLEITIASGEGAEHDIVFEGLNVASKKFAGGTGPVKLTFKVTQSGKFTYFCSIPGHRQIGMEGVLEVTGTGLKVIELAPEVTKEQIAAATGVELDFSAV